MTRPSETWDELKTYGPLDPDEPYDDGDDLTWEQYTQNRKDLYNFLKVIIPSHFKITKIIDEWTSLDCLTKALMKVHYCKGVYHAKYFISNVYPGIITPEESVSLYKAFGRKRCC